ncbi:MAG: RelA/SpoT domain-containing protein [Syntrophorhabdales bacterium]|jgi:ppGpp synthetase/RelA/SpoT-type nucleotidyltranferase
MITDDLEKEYYSIQSTCTAFSDELTRQLKKLLGDRKIALGVPIEHRVKAWDSILSKSERQSVTLKSVTDFDDLIGIRLILLFTRDVSTVCGLITENFDVLESEDTKARLSENQFGYQSFHYLIQLKDKWLSIPSMCSFKGYRAEVQVRTLSQHIWAAASHVLQYKVESSVPASIRRTVYRVSALLETVDLEFDRVLTERETYIREADIEKSTALSNVDLLEKMLNALLPVRNKKPTENYSGLLVELHDLGVKTTGDLRTLIEKQRENILKEDREMAERLRDRDNLPEYAEARIKNGIYFGYVGLVRNALKNEYGQAWEKYTISKGGEVGTLFHSLHYAGSG